MEVVLKRLEHFKNFIKVPTLCFRQAIISPLIKKSNLDQNELKILKIF